MFPLGNVSRGTMQKTVAKKQPSFAMYGEREWVSEMGETPPPKMGNYFGIRMTYSMKLSFSLVWVVALMPALRISPTA